MGGSKPLVFHFFRKYVRAHILYSKKRNPDLRRTLIGSALKNPKTADKKEMNEGLGSPS
jgi:hypothetical protein